MDNVKRIVDRVCSYINRRIMTMNYAQESEIREYVTDSCIFEGKLSVFNFDVCKIADILDVNEMCIYDMFVNEFDVEF